MWKTKEKDTKSQKIRKMAQNRVYIPPELNPLTNPDFEFSQGKTVNICTRIL